MVGLQLHRSAVSGTLAVHSKRSSENEPGRGIHLEDDGGFAFKTMQQHMNWLVFMEKSELLCHPYIASRTPQLEEERKK
jgi:hypothetical protein